MPELDLEQFKIAPPTLNLEDFKVESETPKSTKDRYGVDVAGLDKEYFPPVFRANVQNPSPLVEAGKAVANLPSALARGLTNTLKIIPAGVDVFAQAPSKTEAVKAIGSGALETAGKVTGATAIGNTALGAFQSMIQNITGYDIGDENAEKAFNNFKRFFTDKGYQLEKTGEVAAAVHTMAVEDPQMLPLILEGGMKTVQKARGAETTGFIEPLAQKFTEPIKPLFKEVKESLMETQIVEPVAEFVNQQLGLRGRKAAQLEMKDVDAGRVIAEHTGDIIPTEKGKMQMDAVIERLDEVRNIGYETRRPLLEANNRVSPFSDMVKAVIKEIDNSSMNALDKSRAKETLPEIISELKRANAELIRDGEYIDTLGKEKIKEQAGREARYDMMSPRSTAYRDAMRMTNRAFRKAVEKDMGEGGEALKALNRELGKIEETLSVLDLKRNVNSAKTGGWFGRRVRPVIGAVIGLKSGGLLQGIAGATLINPMVDLLTQMPVKSRSLILERAIQNGNTKMVTLLREVERLTEQAKKEQASRLQLPAGGIPMSPKTDISGINRARIFENNFEQEMLQGMNTLRLPAPEPRIVTPNTQGTPNYRVFGSEGDVGGLRQRITEPSLFSQKATSDSLPVSSPQEAQQPKQLSKPYSNILPQQNKPDKPFFSDRKAKAEGKYKPITEFEGQKVRVPTEKTVYSKDKITVGKYKGLTFTTDTYLLEFEDLGFSGKNTTLATEANIQSAIERATKEAVSLNQPIEFIKSFDFPVAVFEGTGKARIGVNSKYFNYLAKKYKNLELKGTTPDNPVAIFEDGELKGLVMPIKF